MSKSVMVEVDETTKSILEIIEHRITKGTEHSLQEFKQDNSSVIQSMSTKINDSLHSIKKDVTKETDRVGRKLEDILDDMEDHFTQLNTSLAGAKNEQIEAVKTVLLTATDELVNNFNEKLNTLEISNKILNKEITNITKIPESLNQTIEQVSVEFKNNLHKLQTDFEEQLASSLLKQEDQVNMLVESLQTTIKRVEENQHEQEARIQSTLVGIENNVLARLDQIDSNLNEKLHLKQELDNITEKLVRLEQNLDWINQPFYKKWFRKRGQ
jgi:hypothetical protein